MWLRSNCSLLGSGWLKLRADWGWSCQCACQGTARRGTLGLHSPGSLLVGFALSLSSWSGCEDSVLCSFKPVSLHMFFPYFIHLARTDWVLLAKEQETQPVSLPPFRYLPVQSLPSRASRCPSLYFSLLASSDLQEGWS